MVWKIVILLVCSVSFCLAGIKSDHEVKSLPGLDWQPSFKHYSGRLNVSKTRSLSYCLQMSYTWKLRLELDSHRMATSKRFITIAQQTAIDNANFLIAFLEEYPEYKSRDFYISGESYAGCYIPTLANQILSIKDQLQVNLKGLAIGNGVTRMFGIRGMASVNLAFHGAEHTVYQLGQWMRKFCPTGFDNFCEGESVARDTMDAKEFAQLYKKTMQQPPIKRINDYDINRPCYSSEGCSGNGLPQYLNQLEVQRALHFAPEGGSAVKWKLCIDLHYKACTDMTDNAKNVLANNVKVLYFYGETDTVCPFIIGDLFAHKIGKNPKTSTWFVDDLYAGTKTTFDGNLTYTTIADCGHMAAMWKPKQTATAVHHFINDIGDWNN